MLDAQNAVKVDFDPFAEEYNMSHKRRGVALILNHVHFEEMATRKGSVKDALDLKASLDSLGFDVRIYTDPAIKTITTTLQSSKYFRDPVARSRHFVTDHLSQWQIKQIDDDAPSTTRIMNATGFRLKK